MATKQTEMTQSQIAQEVRSAAKREHKKAAYWALRFTDDGPATRVSLVIYFTDNTNVSVRL